LKEGLLPANAKERLRYCQEGGEQVVQFIREMVEIESPSDNKQAVDRVSALIAGKFEALGGRIKFHRVANFGDHLQVDFASPHSGKPILLLGHFDTVYPLGTLAQMPCRLDKGRLYGPGVYDMKSGIALMLAIVVMSRKAPLSASHLN